MRTLFEDYSEQIWSTPYCYGGFSPVGHLLILSRSRDSSLRDNHNYETAVSVLQANTTDDTTAECYDFRSTHFGFGWVEHLLIKPTAPEKLKNLALEVLDELNEFGILDYEGFDEKRYESVLELIENSSEEDLNQARSTIRRMRPEEPDPENWKEALVDFFSQSMEW